VFRLGLGVCAVLGLTASVAPALAQYRYTPPTYSRPSYRQPTYRPPSTPYVHRVYGGGSSGGGTLQTPQGTKQCFTSATGTTTCN
jgi:hypothetical protein